MKQYNEKLIIDLKQRANAQIRLIATASETTLRRVTKRHGSGWHLRANAIEMREYISRDTPLPTDHMFSIPIPKETDQ